MGHWVARSSARLVAALSPGVLFILQAGATRKPSFLVFFVCFTNKPTSRVPMASLVVVLSAEVAHRCGLNLTTNVAQGHGVIATCVSLESRFSDERSSSFERVPRSLCHDDERTIYRYTEKRRYLTSRHISFPVFLPLLLLAACFNFFLWLCACAGCLATPCAVLLCSYNPSAYQPSVVSLAEGARVYLESQNWYREICSVQNPASYSKPACF